MPIDRANAITQELAGETHYFCSTNCLHTFETRSRPHDDVAHPAEISHAH